MSDQEEKKEGAMSIILFYKYHPLSSSDALMEPYCQALTSLCASLELKGRILLGCSDSEGINGTLAGTQRNVRVFTFALLGREYVQQHHPYCREFLSDEITNALLGKFWKASQEFAQAAQVPVLTIDSPSDFKWSSTCEKDLFPDLNIKLVREIIGTGGELASIPLEETAQGYLTPQEWHEEMLHINKEDTVLIDCRNTKEYAIGHFPNAVDPHTTTFNQFPQWARQHAPQLKEKKVLMYCTGGIRCEKASAYLRRQGVSQVRHLKGGVHKYLETFGSEGTFKGKNFVFDGRGAASAQETQLGKEGDFVNMDVESSNDDEIVGNCLYCSAPYDTFHPHCVCTVCREPILVCGSCQEGLEEYHCSDHYHLHSCYFTNLSSFSNDELNRQLGELEQHLEQIAVGKSYRQKRKTLHKQCNKIRLFLQERDAENEVVSSSCRNCGQVECVGNCWGFHGLKRKQVLEQQQMMTDDVPRDKPTVSSSRSARLSGGQRVSKQRQRQRTIDEIQKLQLSLPPSQHSRLGIRVPPPCTRVLQTMVKGKWCGKPVIEVLQSEFAELGKPHVFQDMLEGGLLRLNDKPLTKDTVYTKLKNMDVISRIVHWHEPPMKTPDTISVEKVALPSFNGASNALVYVCDKPSSVPVHPAGPYLSNTLTMMIEAQEKLETRSLIPCHRIDRVTSGLTICCTDVKVARVIQGAIDKGRVRKLYVARVKGRFPESSEEASSSLPKASTSAKWSWKDISSCVEVDAKVETVDAQNGIRKVTATGKSSQSRFRLLAFDPASNSSLIACAPLTGRGHQLRVHLQWLEYPIDGDMNYGGRLLGVNVKDVAVQRMMEATNDSNESLAPDSISSNDVSAAKSACSCCQGGETGIVSSFTKAQLLDGSQIYLHALRYEIPLSCKRKRKMDGADCELSIVLTVGLPKFAQEFGNIDIDWLQDDS